MDKVIVYIHGQGGSVEEAEHYRPLFADSDVIGFDYKSRYPWEAEEEFPRFFAGMLGRYDSITVIANSIGAYFTMCALAEMQIEKAYFISPVADMEKLICDMMKTANVSEAELRKKGEIETPFGQTLSWKYLSYTREHPLHWTVSAHILYGGRDELTSRETIGKFAERIGATLTVMENGEHWFHTDEQMSFLDGWIKER